MKEHYNIALDGPAGSGKSTVAKMLAKQYDILYLDTGAMYRACALFALSEGIDPKDEIGAEKVANEVFVRVEYIDGTQHTFLGDKDVSEEIRKNEVSLAASSISAHKCIREKMVEMQRSIAKDTSCVLDGRDVGSCVLPDARFKFFLTADVRVRAERRFKELTERGQTPDFDTLCAEIELRDKQDKEREFSPLIQANDAVLLDTSNMTAKQVVSRIRKLIKKRVKALKKEDKKKKKKAITVAANKKGRHIIPIMNVLRVIVVPIMWLCLPFRFYGKRKVKDGACVYVCNHVRIWDIVFVACTTWEGIHFLAKKSIAENKFLGFFCKRLKTINAARDGSDVRAMMDGIKCLKNGEKVSVFPEGTRNKTGGEMLPFKPGAATFAIKAKAPIVPMYIYKKPMPFRLNHILIGEPFELSEFYDRKLTEDVIKEADEKLRRSLIGLREEHEKFLSEKKKRK